jgi:hypothetical protein
VSSITTSYSDPQIQESFHRAVDLIVGRNVGSASAAQTLAEALKTPEGFTTVMGAQASQTRLDSEDLAERVRSWVQTQQGRSWTLRKKPLDGGRVNNLVQVLVAQRAQAAEKAAKENAESSRASFWGSLITAASRLDNALAALPSPQEIGDIAARLHDGSVLPGLSSWGLGPRTQLFVAAGVSPEVQALIVHAWATRIYGNELKRVPLEDRGITVADQLKFMQSKYGEAIFEAASKSTYVDTFGTDLTPAVDRQRDGIRANQFIDPKNHSNTSYFTFDKGKGQVSFKLTGAEDYNDYYRAHTLLLSAEPARMTVQGHQSTSHTETMSITTMKHVRDLLQQVVDSPRPARPASAYVQTFETDLQLFEAAQYGLDIAHKVIDEATASRQKVIDDIVRTLCALPKLNM